MRILLLLLAGHALCDYPLQGTFLAKGKNPMLNPHSWRKAMLAHCLIQCGMVLLITGSITLAVCEFCIHWITDIAKCEGKISANEDQAIHYACKVAWAVAIAFWRVP